MWTYPSIGSFTHIGGVLFTVIFAAAWIAQTSNAFNIHNIDPRSNVWLTWANRAGQTDFCLSLAQVGNPFRTCLIGYPYVHWEDFEGFGPTFHSINESLVQWLRNKTKVGECRGNGFSFDVSACMLSKLIEALNVSNPLPTQEIEIWGSFPPVSGSVVNLTTFVNCSEEKQEVYVNGTGAVNFGQPMSNWLARQGVRLFSDYQNVSGNSDHWNMSNWLGCHHANTTGGKRLPPGYFLICGDRAWPAIPRRPIGGPCYIGKLTMFAPSMRHLLTRSQRVTRALKDLSPDCDDNVRLGSLGGTVALSFFVPGGMAAANWRKIKNLACWAVKEFNETSEILSGLASDTDSLRHAVLQNRAAIDFLLLAHGHGCEEFQGMCCMNLSDHSVSIHQHISQLKELIHRVKEGSPGFENWLKSLGLSGWLLDLCKQGMICVIAIFACLMVIGCLFSCLKQAFLKSVQQTWLVQNKNGGNDGIVENDGIIESWLEERGHLSLNRLDLSNIRNTAL